MKVILITNIYNYKVRANITRSQNKVNVCSYLDYSLLIESKQKVELLRRLMQGSNINKYYQIHSQIYR